jgi:hypothetical protein
MPVIASDRDGFVKNMWADFGPVVILFLHFLGSISKHISGQNIPAIFIVATSVSSHPPENSVIELISICYSRSASPRRKRKERSPTPRPTKIHVGRLTRNVTRDHILEIFSTYGTVKSVDFPQDRLHTHTGRGFAYIEFETPNEAENAMKHMDGGMGSRQECNSLVQ